MDKVIIDKIKCIIRAIGFAIVGSIVYIAYRSAVAAVVPLPKEYDL